MKTLVIYQIKVIYLIKWGNMPMPIFVYLIAGLGASFALKMEILLAILKRRYKRKNQKRSLHFALLLRQARSLKVKRVYQILRSVTTCQILWELT